MSIDLKYFQQDKNYLLKTVQAFSKEALLHIWTQEAYKSYIILENPLGLEDSFTLSIQSSIHKGSCILDEVYDLIAAVYRLKEDNNQLSFMWDGRSHMEYYDAEWRTTFGAWIIELCKKGEIHRAIIKASLADKKTNTDFLANSIRLAILDHFKIKQTRSRKLQLLSA